MEIKLNRLDDNYLMEAVNENGNTLRTDGSPAIGGSNQAMRPMQLLLAAVGSCSSIDIISLLRKQRQDLQDIKITVNGDREEGKVPSLFTKIRVHYDLYGDIDEKKAKRAVDLSMEKYCSVSLMLNKQAEFAWSYAVHPSAGE